ncbi:MAG TPA: hypothetical protein VKQ06_07885, partial [Gammaproteobacteria bacterium]|nr:hypothetical protein [Gammaproteobacteria bacterium]
MTNSRDMAEQAFTLLQNALEESESQRLNLEQRLNLDRPPASEIEQAYDSLQVELEHARTERDLWKKTSNQLQDVVSNERSKAKRLARKLDVVESGTDRIARREVNFWRDKATEFETAKQEFQRRIHELKAQLKQRDEHDENLWSNEVKTEELENLRELLETRDTSVAELSASLENSKLQVDAQNHRIAELDAEVRRLSEQVIEAETARNEACRAADAIDAELKDLRAQDATHQQALESAQHQAQRHAGLNEEFQRRIDELETQHDREIAALREEQGKETVLLREQHQQALAQLQTQAQADAQAVEAANAQYESRIAELTAQLETQTANLTEVEQRNSEL